MKERMRSRDLSSAEISSDKAVKKSCMTGNLQEAEVILSCGRGLQTKSGFDLAFRAAGCISAQIAGTRAAVDMGWIPADREIGLSGARVAPEIYIACGVSGTNFHMIGIKHAKKVIAINTDPSAPIFQKADIRIEEDVGKVLLDLLNTFSGKDSLHHRSVHHSSSYHSIVDELLIFFKQYPAIIPGDHFRK
jgi:electron transfer flavoprotein alpha subunit